MLIDRNAPRAKVAHLTSVHTPSDGRIVHKECASLAEAGYDVVVIAPGQGELPAGVRLHSVCVPRNRLERATRTVWAVFRAALKERARVYHFHDPELIGVGVALRLTGARVIFDVHEDIPGDIIDKPWIPQWLRVPVSFAARGALWALQRAFNAIVAATPAIARQFAATRTVVIHNYPRTEQFASVPNTDFTDRPAVALYPGNITQLRCIDEIIEAFTDPVMGRDIRLLLAGPFDDEQLALRVKQLKGWDRVDYLGIVPRSGMAKVLAGARVGLLLLRPAANHEDALPTKLFEYMAAGLPVIISSSLRCSEVVREFDFGLVVEPFDVKGIAEAITAIVSDPQRAKAMGERGRRLVFERYQWDTEAVKLRRLYASLA